MKKEVEYRQGNTTVWSDGDKIVITNPSGPKHIQYNVDQIFGLGEYAKIFNVKYSYSEEVHWNPHAKETEIVSGYIPVRVKSDLSSEDSLPGIKADDLVGKFFKGKK